MSLVVFREFPDGGCELGVVTLEHHGYWVCVGDFDYYLPWNSFEYPFTIIGIL
jgi:hypothetical protein